MRTLLVTVAGAGGRRDLSLPADAPVAELLPVLAHLVGGGAAADGWTLTPAGGRPLPADASLATGGVLNGALLKLQPPRPAQASPPAKTPPPPRDGRTPVERTAAALPRRQALPERARLAAIALLATPGTQPGASTAPGQPAAPPRPQGGLASALLAAAAAAARHHRAAPPAAAAFAPSPAELDAATPPPHGANRGNGTSPGNAPSTSPAGAADPTRASATTPSAGATRHPPPARSQQAGGWGRPLDRLGGARRSWRSGSYLRLLDEAVRRPRLARPLTVAVVAARHGVGASTVTGLLGTLLAAHRQERVLAVDAGGSDGPGSLARILGIGREPGDQETGEGGTDDLLARLGRAMPAAAGPEPRPAWLHDDLVARLARAAPTRAGLDARLGHAAHGLAVLPAPARRAPLDERAWLLALERLRSLYQVLLVDCGALLDEPAGRAAVRACDQLLLVSDADPAGASLAVEAGLPLVRAGLPVTLVVNGIPAGADRAGMRHRPSLDLDRLGRYLPDARGLVTVPDAPEGASELAMGTFRWPGAVAGWRRAAHELAACLVADWPSGSGW